MTSEVSQDSKRRARFTLDENSIAHLQSVLSDLYTDRETAVLRELSVNGYDAQKAIGCDAPVRVTLPSPANRHTLTIEDSGVGMSEDELFDLYSKYGASSKRDDNSTGQTGMLGLGSKAPLALVNTFDVTSVKDGVETVARVTKSDDDVAEIVVVSSGRTARQSGTSISLVVSAVNSFAAKAEVFFQYWEEGSVLVDGEEPRRVAGEELDDVFTLVPGARSDIVMMGNVPYPVAIPPHYRREGLLEHRAYNNSYGIVAKVPLGSVHFTPSRESLNYTPATVDYLKSLRKDFRNAVMERIVDEVNLAPTKTDALKVFTTWERREFKLSIPGVWWGHTIPTSFTVNHLLLSIGKENRSSGKSRMGKSHSSWMNATEIFHSTNPHLTTSVIVTGWERMDKKPTQTMKNKLLHLLDQKGYDQVSRVYFVADLDGADGWLDGVVSFTADEVAAVKLPRAQKAKKAKSSVRSWRTWEHGKGPEAADVSSSTLREKKLVLYASPTELGFSHLAPEEVARKLVAVLNPNEVFVMVNKNQWGTFTKENPRAQYFPEWRKIQVNGLVGQLSEKDMIRHYVGSSHIARLLNPEDVLDPELAEWSRVIQSFGENPKKSETVNRLKLFSELGERFKWPAWEISDPSEKYALLGVLSSWLAGAEIREHMTVYVNSMWEQRFAGGEDV